MDEVIETIVNKDKFWENIYAIISYQIEGKQLFKVCFSEKELEEQKVLLLFDSNVHDLRVRGPKVCNSISLEN